MKLDKHPSFPPTSTSTTTTTTTTDSPLTAAAGKPKKWANVRRKFALIVANRNSGAGAGTTTTTSTTAPTHAAATAAIPNGGDLAVSQAESFCRPYIQHVPVAVALEQDRERERDREFASLTKHNSERNKEITSPLYSAPKPAAGTKTKRKKRTLKIVRFIEEPFVIRDAGPIGSDAEEGDGEEEDEEEEEEEQGEGEDDKDDVAPPPPPSPPPPPPPPRPISSQHRAGPGFGGATIRVVRQQ